MSDKSNPYDAPDTGHVWDETLRELTNQPPKWWMIGFYASLAIVVFYIIWYPAIPLVDSHTKGVAGWTAIKEYKEDLKSIEAKRSVYEDKLPGMSAAAILGDEELSTYVQRSAKVLFGDNCAACHGTEGAGNQGYPVLADNDWLFGGSIQAIEQSIIAGRNGNMPAHTMSDDELNKLADAIIAGNPGSEPLFSAKGCFACHGADGKGMQALGAANLTDKIWRFAAADQRESVKHTIIHGINFPSDAQTRNAVMPKFGGGKLSDTEIKKLAVYVHKLGGGQ
ncbi:MAG: cytochrome-c oxidase, cbb3-type subunit III [Pseudomonadota bacterium]